MEDNFGFRKRPRPAGSSMAAQVIESSGGSRTGGKAGGAKSGGAKTSVEKGPSVRIVSSRSKKKDPDVADHIARQLKAVYDDMLSQPVPERFLDLLSKLDSKSGH